MRRAFDKPARRVKLPAVHILLSWLAQLFAVWLAAQIIPGFRVKSFGYAIWVAAIFGLVNLLLGWLLFGVLVVATLGIGYSCSPSSPGGSSMRFCSK